jgi:hypothetical protein
MHSGEITHRGPIARRFPARLQWIRHLATAHQVRVPESTRNCFHGDCRSSKPPGKGSGKGALLQEIGQASGPSLNLINYLINNGIEVYVDGVKIWGAF